MMGAGKQTFRASIGEQALPARPGRLGGRLRIAALLLLPAIAIASAPLLRAQRAPAAAAAKGAEVEVIPSITVQIAPPPLSITSLMNGGAGPLGARPVTGKPFAAEFVTQHHQVFADGNRISRSTTSVIYRDAQGRIRRESQLSLPGLAANVSRLTYITIVDRQKGYGWFLDPQERVAHRFRLNGVGPAYVARVNAKGNGVDLFPAEPKVPVAKSSVVKSSRRAARGQDGAHALVRPILFRPRQPWDASEAERRRCAGCHGFGGPRGAAGRNGRGGGGLLQ